MAEAASGAAMDASVRGMSARLAVLESALGAPAGAQQCGGRTMERRVAELEANLAALRSTYPGLDALYEACE